MKKVYKFIIFIFMFLPLFVNARVDYDSAVNYVNNYISRFENYSDYIYLNSRIPYVFLNGENVYDSDFTNGGMLSAEEYAVTNFQSNTYLANGLEYWTLTQADYNRYYVINYKLERAFLTDQSGVRVTEFIKDDASVVGIGSYADPWEFEDVMSVHINSDNTIRGKVSTVDCSDTTKKKTSVNINVVDGKEKTFYICPENGYKYYKSACSKYIISDGGNKYHLKDVDKDNLICNVSFTYATNKVTINRCSGCTSDSSPSTVYVNKVFNLWFTDSNGLNQITKINSVPVKKGYTFNGYKNGSTLIIKPNGTFNTSNITSNISVNPAFTANTYTVNLSASDATSTNHTTSIQATYDSDLPVITFPERSYTVNFNPNGGTVSNGSLTSTYSFLGYYYGSTKYYNGGVSKWNIDRNETLIAKWTGGAVTTPVPVKQGYIFEGWYDGAGNKIVDGGVSYFATSNITLTAKWSPGTSNYTVKHFQQNLSDNDYTLVSTQTLSGTTDTSVTPSRNSYTGFTAPAGQTVNIDASGNRVVNYYYTRNSYTVSLTKGTGVSSVSSNNTYKYGASVTVSCSLNAGYSFLSWSGTLSSSNQSYTFTMPANNVSLTANGKGVEVAYKVQHWKRNVNSTESTLAQTETLSAITDTSVTPSRKTYTGFNSPSAQTVNVNGDGSTVVNYYYTRKSYTVTGSKGTGISSVSGSGTYEYGASVTLKANLSSGYYWGSWSDGTTNQTYTFSMGASNVTVTANANPVKYTITYNCNGGTGTTNSSTHYYDQAAALTANGCSKTNYKFIGWDYNGTTYSNKQSVSNLTTTNNAVLTFDAMWTLDVADYKVNHNQEVTSGGSYSLTESTTHTDTIGKTVTPAVKTYTGFVSPSTQSATVKADGSTVISYNYNRYRYTVSYDCNGGSGTTSSSTHLYGVAKTLTNNNCTKTGFHFSKWTTAADGSGTSYTNKQSVTNLSTSNNAVVTLYALWGRNTYTINYDCNGGTGSTASSSHSYGVAANLSVNGCSRPGYSYGGWTTNSDGTGTAYSNQQSVTSLTSTNNGSVTLYAKWTKCSAGYYSTGLSCTACSAGTYGSTAGATSSSACTTCPAGYYCTGATNKTACPAGTYRTSTGGTSSSSCTTCPAGYYCTGGTNKTACPAGTYRTSTGGTAASSCTSCAAGKYSTATAATASSTCVTCETGYYCTGGSNKTACPAGTYGTSTGGTSSSSCTTCPNGHYCTGGTNKTACPAGTYRTSTGGTSSSSCTTCPAGYYCTGVSNKTACPAGTYRSSTGGTASSSCTSCAAGKYSTATAATASSTCVTCETGYYCTGGSNKTLCPAGTYGTTAGGTSSSSCTTCPAGYYCTGGTNKTACPAGTYRTSTGGTSSSSCSTCPAGYYCTGGSNKTACPAGTYRTSTGGTASSSCTSCAAGTYSVAGSTACSNCEAGYYCPGGSARQSCPSGYTSAAKATAASSCYVSVSAGKYVSSTTSATQSSCPAGKYKAAHTVYYGSSSSCTCCGSGSYSASGAGSCTTCPAGSYNSASCSSSCTTCPAGYYCTGGTSKTACPAGTYRSSTGGTSSSSCTTCPAGTYRTSTGGTSSSSCTTCPAGYYCTGGTNKSACPAGKYRASTGGTSSSSCSSCPAWQTSSAGATSCTDKATSTVTVAKSYYKEANGSYSTGWVGWSAYPNHVAGSDYGTLEAFVQRFTAPSFSGTAKSIKFKMWGVRPSTGTYPSSVTLRYAITKESSMSLYANKTGAISDSNAIASGVATYTNVALPSGSENWITVTVDGVTGLASGGSYVLVMWPNTSDNGLIVWQTGYHDSISVTYY